MKPRPEEPLPAGVDFWTIGPRRVLLARPHPRMYGHQVLEILYALAFARLTGLPLVLRRPRRAINDAVFDVECDGVRLVRSSSTRLAAVLAGTVAAGGENLAARRARVADALREEALAEFERYRLRHAGSAAARTAEKAFAARAKEARARRKNPDGVETVRRPYWRRRLIADPLPVRMAPEAAARAAACARRLGIADDARVVTVHSRERGYKLGAETQDTKGARDDSVRNARIESYFAAVDLLVDRGYTVVRIGDPTMTPVERRGVVDLATSPARDAYVELYCIWRSRFMLCGESGPFAAAHLMGTPLLTVNGTDPVSGYPLRATGILLLKNVVERATGHVLALGDLLSEDYLTDLRDPIRFDYVENTPEQILDAVREMLDLLEHGTPESAAQARFRRLALETSDELQHLQYVRKWGADDGFIGHGRFARQLTDAAAAADAAEPARTIAAGRETDASKAPQ